MNIEQMIRELSIDEGLRLKPYRCSAGKLTIGVGRNLDDVGITVEEANHLLANDIARAADDLDKFLPWWSSLDEVRQRVILNMAFNMGIMGLLGFHVTLDHVHAGRYAQAADSMLNSLWAKQVGPRARRLATMMREGGVNAG